MRLVVCGIILFLGALMGALNIQAADAAAGAGNYAICASCHGAQGEGNVAMNAPKLAGQKDWYLISQLTAFKTGLRGAAAGDSLGAQMRGMAMTLATDADVANVSAYIAGLSPQASPKVVDGDATRGQSLRSLCSLSWTERRGKCRHEGTPTGRTE